MGGAQGWNRVRMVKSYKTRIISQVRIPIRASSFPSFIVILADRLAQENHYIGVDDIALTNDKGHEIGCGKHVCFSTQLFEGRALRVRLSLAYKRWNLNSVC